MTTRLGGDERRAASPRLLDGLVAATHTPFARDGGLALDVVPRQAEHLLAQGVTKVFIGGSTGESLSLTVDERLALLEVLRSAALAGFTMLAAVPVGLGLAWLLLSVINVEAFGWRLPMHVVPLDWLRLLLLAVASAVLSALLPALWLMRRQPADLVKVFANER